MDIDEEYRKQKWLSRSENFFPFNPELAERANTMRKNQTKSETKLWNNFLKQYNSRESKNSLKILRQKVIDNYIVDFYIHSLKLVIEIDGQIHEEKKEYDSIRDEVLKKYWLQIVRIKNEDIEQNFDSVCNQLKELLELPPLERGARGDTWIKLNKSWRKHLKWEFEKQYMKDIKSFLATEIDAGKTIYPHPKDIFNALNSCDFHDIKVVILGQDPYHWAKQANWLSFSVRDWVKVPPSLQNIYKELEDEFWIKKDFTNGNLEPWAQQWVLLLNSVLSVEASKPASHSKIWWQNFTDKIIQTISDKKQWVVFLLWWAFAIWKKELIDESQHLVLTSPHPSPFSAYKWFYGNMHFQKCNTYLQKQRKKEILW